MSRVHAFNPLFDQTYAVRTSILTCFGQLQCISAIEYDDDDGVGMMVVEEYKLYFWWYYE